MRERHRPAETDRRFHGADPDPLRPHLRRHRDPRRHLRAPPPGRRDALKDWGLAHRFAGSGDRAAIASLVYDGLRRRASAAFVMGAETGRAVTIGMLRLQRGLAEPTISSLFDGARFAPEPLTDGSARG